MVSPRALSFAAIRSAWGSNSCIITGPPVVAASTLPVPPPALQELVSRGATRMARDGDFPSSGPITERILAIRDRWHTKRHPFFLAFGEGKLPLKALGRYQALHYHFVSRALASFGLLYARGYHFEERRGRRVEGDPRAGSRAA